MKKILVLFLLIVQISCQNNSKNCCKTKMELAENIIQALKDDNIAKYKSLFLPVTLNGIPADKNENTNVQDYENIKIESYVNSKKEFADKGIDIKTLNIVDVQEFDSDYKFEIYDSIYNHYKFNVILSDKGNNLVKAEIKCVQIGDKFFFRDDVSIRN